MTRVFVTPDGTWGEMDGVRFINVDQMDIHAMNEMSDAELSEYAPSRVQNPTADGTHEVTGMFDDGLFEVHEIGTDNYTTLDVNKLLADGQVLDRMVQVYRTSSSQSDETEGVWHELQIARPDNTQKMMDDEEQKAVSGNAS